ncbi:MAG: hypothetical protein AAGF25_05960, partial [Pseudomonadota bacterium]
TTYDKSTLGTYPKDGTEEDQQKFKDSAKALRTAQFEKNMQELGLSNETHDKELPFGHKDSLPRKYDSPAGERASDHNYIDPIAAGDRGPDMLVKQSDGTYAAKWPKTDGIKDLNQARELYATEDILLRDSRGRYRTPESIDKGREINLANYPANKPALSSNDLMDRYVGNTRDRTRDDLPKVLVEDRHNKGVFKEKDQSVTPEELKTENVLIQKRNGKGFVTPEMYAKTQGPNAAANLQELGIPEDIQKFEGKNPQVLVQATKNVVISGDRAKRYADGASLAEKFDKDKIFVENTGAKTGVLTGAYVDVNTYEKTHGADHTKKHLDNLGVADDFHKTPEAAAMADAFKNTSTTKGMATQSAITVESRAPRDDRGADSRSM